MGAFVPGVCRTRRNASIPQAPMPSVRPAAKTAPSAVHYRVEPTDLNAHLFTVTLTVAEPKALQEVSLPVWIPGSYLVREFSKNLQQLKAQQGKHDAHLTQLDKHRWQAKCATGKPLVLTYVVCAYDNSVRTAWLDASRGFFNGTSLCLRVHGAGDVAAHVGDRQHTPHGGLVCSHRADGGQDRQEWVRRVRSLWV